jgi:hypothetical protein
MNEAELRELIVTRLCNQPPIYKCNNPEHYSHKTASTICKECLADQILNLFKEDGWVRLDEDQSLPELHPEDFSKGMIPANPQKMELLRQGMEWLKHEAGFRKVKNG